MSSYSHQLHPFSKWGPLCKGDNTNLITFWLIPEASSTTRVLASAGCSGTYPNVYTASARIIELASGL